MCVPKEKCTQAARRPDVKPTRQLTDSPKSDKLFAKRKCCESCERAHNPRVKTPVAMASNWWCCGLCPNRIGIARIAIALYAQLPKWLTLTQFTD